MASAIVEPVRIKTSDFARFGATTGHHRKPDPDLAETKDEKKHVRETALPTGKIEPETRQGRADVGDVPTAETLGSLARKRRAIQCSSATASETAAIVRP